MGSGAPVRSGYANRNGEQHGRCERGSLAALIVFDTMVQPSSDQEKMFIQHLVPNLNSEVLYRQVQYPVQGTTGAQLERG